MKTKISMKSKQEITIDGAFELFIRNCTIRNLSARTIKTYKHHFSIWSRYKPSEDNICDIDKETVEEYILYLRENTNANEITINSYLRSIRAFLYFCMESNYLDGFKVVIPKAEKKCERNVFTR